MSILIKGLEMPSACDECWALDESGDYPMCRITEETRGYNFRVREKRMDRCPLIEIPNHGDLIDKDVLLKRLRNYACKPCKEYSLDKNGDRCKWCSFDDAFARIEKAKKVIPAERSEDGKT